MARILMRESVDKVSTLLPKFYAPAEKKIHLHYKSHLLCGHA